VLGRIYRRTAAAASLRARESPGNSTTRHLSLWISASVAIGLGQDNAPSGPDRNSSEGV